jgi:hypothetical protein
MALFDVSPKLAEISEYNIDTAFKKDLSVLLDEGFSITFEPSAPILIAGTPTAQVKITVKNKKGDIMATQSGGLLDTTLSDAYIMVPEK